MKKSLLLFLLIVPFIIRAQNTMYYLEGVPQSTHFNPSFMPDAKFHLELPALGGVSAHAYNAGFDYYWLDDFITSVGNGTSDPDQAIQTIGDFNHFFTEARVNILSFGFKLKEKGYLTFNSSVNSTSEMAVASDIVYLLADLNDFTSEDFPLVVDGIDLLTNNYLSLGVTYSRKINDHLTVGVTPHLNFNFMGIRTENVRLTVEEEETPGGDTEYPYALDGKVTLGLPAELNPAALDGNELDLNEDLLPPGWEEDLAFSDLFRNKSLSLDLGATYALDKWMFSASLLNIGASKYSINGYTLRGQGETVLVQENQKVSLGIPAKLFLGAKRQFSERWNYAVVFRNDFYKADSNASATVSLNGIVGRMLSTSVSYTAGYKFNNIGIGLRARFLPGTDLFFVTDNIIQSFNVKKAHRMSAAFGVNLFFGVRDRLEQNL